jgi:hypothetical protein
MTRSKHGFGDNNLNDRQRAQLRGKGRAPDYAPGSEEGTRLIEETGLTGDTTGLRGQQVGSQDTPRNEYLNESHIPEDVENLRLRGRGTP